MPWRSLALLCLALGSWHLSGAIYIHLKAELAQVLIARAWASGSVQRPWPWADTWPVAELIVPGLDVSRIVLAGDSGESLAFGPGHSFASAMPEDRPPPPQQTPAPESPAEPAAPFQRGVKRPGAGAR